MKYFLLAIASTLVASTLTGCYGIADKGISGHLEFKKNSGWTTLDFKDGKTGKIFSLQEGDYTMAYQEGIYGYRYPMISISDKNGNLVGHLEIPRKSLREDGSFEIYVGDRSNTNSFNILGGFRKIINSRKRFAKLKASCSYTEVYTCMESDGKGGTRVSTCTRLVSGNQDEIWENHDYQNNYRIVFDGADLMNIAIFRAKSPTQNENVLIGSESCH
ncbi:MAG: hypothetical protein A4S09_04745 [Proteobacteria bacterium SG_bin7]|nr:MAG: hypothetical protein A4S09_04745 [Proteobacteria bacterium SG_bin7]